MSRYYNGDISGKFMFGIQDSDAADQFGVEGVRPNILEYYYDIDDLPKVEKRLDELNNILKGDGNKVEDYINKKRVNELNDILKGGDNRINNSYTTTDIASALNMSEKHVNELLLYIADKRLGKEIYDALIELKQCYFEAEL